MNEDIGFNYFVQETGEHEENFWKNEVKNMMNAIKNMSEVLLKTGKLSEVPEFPEEGIPQEKSQEKENADSWLEEIAKMDAILRAKGNEEKKARLSRIQAEEESKEILSGLLVSQNCNTSKVNLEEFLKLLNEIDADGPDSLVTHEGKKEEKERGEEEGEKEEKAKENEEQKKKNLKFLERNIELAKYGRGLLSLTEEEKSRIETVLSECEEEEKQEEVPEGSETSKKDIYGMDEEMRAKLSEIDEKLQALTRGRAQPKVKEKPGEGEKRGKEKEKKKTNQLTEIDKLLGAINSATNEEVDPLPEEELKILIETSKEHLSEGTERQDFALPREVLADLLSKAKSLMPKFKYKYKESA